MGKTVYSFIVCQDLREFLEIADIVIGGHISVFTMRIG
jgi:hypothetical protein